MTSMGDGPDRKFARVEMEFVDATDVVDAILADPDLAEESEAIRERLREADRVHAMNLRWCDTWRGRPRLNWRGR